MADGRHFENVKSPYLCDRSTNFDEIWHGNAYCPLAAVQPLNFFLFLKIQDCDGRHLEKSQKS